MEKYFASIKKLKGTCYHEFYKGKWDEKTHWKEDSIYLHDDYMHRDFVKLLVKNVPNYEYFGPTTVTKVQWDNIKAKATKKGGKAEALVSEVESWISDTFSKHDEFTILGI
ncbi:MAG: hypothetical protein IIW33_00195 [Oscillospiraceae bacterium]|nr:hypothetical protein [Oscillospiraceae bacterium]